MLKRTARNLAVVGITIASATVLAALGATGASATVTATPNSGQATVGHTDTEALRALKRKLSDTVYRRLLADAAGTATAQLGQAA
jgi:hypothetical protein